MRLLLAIGVLAVAIAPAAATQQCPASAAQLDTVVRTIRSAPGCEAAYKVMEACAFGSSADVQTGAAVVEICRRDMTEARKASFERESKACAAKYANKDGTMYLSMAAFCAAKAAVKHHKRS